MLSAVAFKLVSPLLTLRNIFYIILKHHKIPLHVIAIGVSFNSFQSIVSEGNFPVCVCVCVCVCIVNFISIIITSAPPPDHLALDPEGWGPLQLAMYHFLILSKTPKLRIIDHLVIPTR